MTFSEILDGNSAEPLGFNPLNAGDSVAAGMPQISRDAVLVAAGRAHPDHVRVVGVILLVPLQSARILAASAEHARQRVAERLPKVLKRAGASQSSVKSF